MRDEAHHNVVHAAPTVEIDHEKNSRDRVADLR
jgi:hypothetical protein